MKAKCKSIPSSAPFTIASRYELPNLSKIQSSDSPSEVLNRFKEACQVAAFAGISFLSEAGGIFQILVPGVSMRQDKNSALFLTVRELVSSFVLYRRCFLPLAHPRPLILPHHFSFRNMRYQKAAWRCAMVS